MLSIINGNGISEGERQKLVLFGTVSPVKEKNYYKRFRTA